MFTIVIGLRRVGGGRPITLEKKDFELGVGGEGQDTFRHFEDSFGPIRAILPCEASEQKP